MTTSKVSTTKRVVKTYDFQASTDFTVQMQAKREILAVQYQGWGESFQFLVEEEPDSTDLADFRFIAVKENEKFDKEEGWEYLGQIGIVVDPTSDRPVAETHFVYGRRLG